MSSSSLPNITRVIEKLRNTHFPVLRGPICKDHLNELIEEIEEIEVSLKSYKQNAIDKFNAHQGQKK